MERHRYRIVFKDVPAGFQIVGPDMRGNGASSGFEGIHHFQPSARDIFVIFYANEPEKTTTQSL
jgi:hypothetical protein